MRKSLIILILITIGFCSCGQSNKSMTEKVAIDLKVADSTTKDKTPTHFPSEHINTESIYTDSTYTNSNGIDITIQNSFPRGGPYTDPTGKTFGQAIFWSRVINESDIPIELTINFPADSLAVPTWPDYRPRFYVSQDASLYNLNQTDLHTFLDTGLNQPTFLRKTLAPKEECLFNIGTVNYQPGGMVRAGLVLKEQALFYSISIIPHFDSALFPCGQIVLKKLKE